MKKLSAAIYSSVLALALPVVAFAQFDPKGGEFGVFLKNILEFINNVIIPFILGIGFLVFVWGMFYYFIVGGVDDDKKNKGKSLMVYATLGFVLIIIFWGVVNLVADGTGFAEQKLENIPETVQIGT